ncbi:DUF3137 domain-containing protein [Candidatus Gracilibacteria bacterium]|nr:DUF3137 domain-containing protein [Candidatus Gracilibacteria bacterium]
MQKLDFSSLRTQYSLLTDEDVGFLNQFFNTPETQTILKETEKTRKKYIIVTPIFVICSLLAMYGLYYFLPNAIISVIIFAGFAIFGLFHIFKDSITTQVKDRVLARMMKEISEKISYRENATYFKDSIQQIISETKLLKSYDRLDFMEDSVEIIDDTTGITITGVEVKTSNKHTDSKGRTTYTTNNHCYLMKIKFHNPKYTIKNAITLFPEKSIFQGIFATGLTIVFFILFLGMFWTFRKEMGDAFYIYFSLIMVVFGSTGIFTIYTWFKNKKRLVRLENADFEKKFEVYCDDQIESRKVLTPDFMYRIYDYTNKIDKNRKYSLYFKDDYIYIKFDVSSDFLEISAFKSLLKNLTQYVEFYLEMKNISALADDLKLGFYDKNFSRKQVIK